MIQPALFSRSADTHDRRRVILYAALTSGTLSTLLALFSHVHAFVGVVLLAYVAVTFTQYSLIVSHVNDHIEPARHVAASAMLLLMFSLGGMIGPVATSLFMTVAGPKGLFLFNATTCFVLAVVAARAVLRKR
ncbi:MFS transporter [Burkholderia ambifaria]|uniref:MFS transporter n=1 Tax=Burkholderia ambifaria TaxID=152480 RepID=UPI0031FDF9AE